MLRTVPQRDMTRQQLRYAACGSGKRYAALTARMVLTTGVLLIGVGVALAMAAWTTVRSLNRQTEHRATIE